MSAHIAPGSPRLHGDRAQRGTVYLVGAGPGDPGLLTIRAAALLDSCDLVFHDHLVSEGVLARASRTAVRVDVGKVGHGPSADQIAISASLVQAARAGMSVVRLKGGDPYLFGRGAEEALALVEAGVPYEVVPGVSALSAVPARAGIPLTHRGIATSVGVVAGACAGDGRLSEAVSGAAQADTVVAFMALANLEGLVRTLVASGRAADTPAAAIASGTTADETTVVSTLEGLVAAVRIAHLPAPVLVVVGQVVALRDQLVGDARVGAAAAVPADRGNDADRGQQNDPTGVYDLTE
ncbi:Uroporphyrinogen-III C-methyltransferase [Luteitalea pratensis]|uniref:uroporphyrinogen-III C-methyltransferase n=1 Tax=Luteitalea pratensis TaxID=1855912 RepID=A0A143PKM8_LUTPR|nr:uroporphyrinogen-III C-methyltransferase [Luteitalea pratensis]AMY08324.1 Uroporphyrinogen-III C-methyltransferase [Luteitalea pratensis]